MTTSFNETFRRSRQEIELATIVTTLSTTLRQYRHELQSYLKRLRVVEELPAAPNRPPRLLDEAPINQTRALVRFRKCTHFVCENL